MRLIQGLDASVDLSGAVVVGDFLVIGADEGHLLQVLRRDQGGERWQIQQKLPLAKRNQETDIEAITYGNGYLYVIGSHSFRRRQMKPHLSRGRNLERLLETDGESPRNRLYRLAFDAESGRIGEIRHMDLSKRLRKDPLLGLFWGIPGKENGIDIEGLAFRDGNLHLGFRGPVLGENYVPVMSLEFTRAKHYELRFVRLDGQGIRDMCSLERGFMVLSGPVNDAPGPFCLWWWDGEDQIPDKGRQVVPAVLLDEVSTRGGAKAEGLALLEQTARQAKVLVVYETGTSAQAVTMQVDLPALHQESISS